MLRRRALVSPGPRRSVFHESSRTILLRGGRADTLDPPQASPGGNRRRHVTLDCTRVKRRMNRFSPFPGRALPALPGARTPAAVHSPRRPARGSRRCPRSTSAPSPGTTRRSCSCRATRTGPRRIAALFDGGLEATRRVNDHRLLYGYTGTYRGVPISVQTTGMGAPAAAIVVEELLRLGARRLIRVGTCGGIGTGIRTGEIVIATAASPFDGTTATYLHGEPYAPAADFLLTRALVDAAEAAGATPPRGADLHGRRLLQPRRRLLQPLGGRGACWPSRWRARPSSSSPPARRAAGADVRAATILTVSDVLGEGVTSEDTYLPLDELERRTATTLQVALAAATSPAVTAGL